MTSASVVTTRDGDTVRMFQGVDGPFYRACNGNRCVNCRDLVIALEHLKVWRQKLCEITSEQARTNYFWRLKV